MSALQGTGILESGKTNYGAYLATKPFSGSYPNPSEMITGQDHVLIVDSRSRNKRFYPNASKYMVKIPTPYKNVTSIELKGSLIPKTEHNVNLDNRSIPFNIEDFITNAIIKDRGFGYIDGTYGFGTADPTAARITDPGLAGGTAATITVTVENNRIVSAIIPTGEEGSGYLRGYYGGVIEDPTNGFFRRAQASFIDSIPKDPDLKDRFKSTDIEIQVGHELIAALPTGMYDFANVNDFATSPGLALAVTTALQVAVQDAIDDGVITPVVGGPTTGVEYFPNAVAATGTTGSAYLTTINTNASGNANVVIQRGGDGSLGYTQDTFLELIFGSTELTTHAGNLLGFGSNNEITAGYFPPIDQTTGDFSSYTAGNYVPVPAIGRNDYNLTDSPKYVILSITPLQDTRIDSVSEELSKGYATLTFDANMPDVIFREPNTTGPGTGDSNYSSLLAKPGTLKGIKGQDYDSKFLSFGPVPVAEISEFMVEFKTFGGNFYNFQGEDHVLIFQFAASDINSARN
jgi:hypothetical protein